MHQKCAKNVPKMRHKRRQKWRQQIFALNNFWREKSFWEFFLRPISWRSRCNALLPGPKTPLVQHSLSSRGKHQIQKLPLQNFLAGVVDFGNLFQKKFWRQHSKHKKLLDNVWSAFGIIATNKVSSARWKQRIVQLGAMQWLNNQSFKISFFLQSWATQLLSSERSDSLKSSIIITLWVLLVFTTIRGIKHANIGPKQAK